MYQKILVPLALGHGISEQTLGVARKIAAADGEIVALHVFEVPSGSVSTYIGKDVVDSGFQKAKALLDQKTKHLDGVKAEIIRGHAHRAIVEHATTHGFDCIVIGSHKPGLSDYYLGSTAARVVRHAPCAVHVHRDA